jgi:hypothetical protein
VGIIDYVSVDNITGQTVNLIGWGINSTGHVSENLKVVDSKIISNTECGQRVTDLDGELTIFDMRYVCTFDQPMGLLQVVSNYFNISLLP